MNFWIKAFRKIISNEFPDVKSLREKPESYFQIGKKVRVINNLEYVKCIENKYGGGWTDEMKECLNEICTVLNVDPDKMIQVKTTSGKTWLFKKDSLESIYSEDEDIVVEKVPTKSTNPFNEDDLLEKEPSKLINQSKLFKAIENGNLIDLNPKIPKRILNKKNRDGMTPLFFACFIGKLDIVLWLCDKGADPKIPDKSGDLPIHNCALNRNYKILSVLIERFPSTVNTTRKNGETLTDIAKMLDDKNIENIIKQISHKKSSEIIAGNSNITESLNLPYPPEDGSYHNKIIPNLAKTFHQPKNLIYQSQKTIIGGSLCNRESITLPNPPEDCNSNNELIPEPPITLHDPQDSIRKLPKTITVGNTYNSGIINLPYPPDDCSLKSCETLKFENIYKTISPPESISSHNEIIPEPPKTLHNPKDSMLKLQKAFIGVSLNNSGIINLPYPPNDGSFKMLENLKFESINKNKCHSKSISANQRTNNNLDTLSEK